MGSKKKEKKSRKKHKEKSRSKKSKNWVEVSSEEEWEEHTTALSANTDASSSGGGKNANASSTSTSKPEVERDAWMTTAPARSLSGATRRGAQADREEEEKKKKEKGAEELPPGLVINTEKGLVAADHTPNEEVKTVGDGGAGWRQKALQRAMRMAQEEGRSLEEVVAERWGSLAELTGALADSGSRHADHSSRGRDGDRSRSRAGSGTMKAPWSSRYRERQSDSRREEDRRRERERAIDRYRNRDGERSDRHHDGSRSRDEGHESHRRRSRGDGDDRLETSAERNSDVRSARDDRDHNKDRSRNRPHEEHRERDSRRNEKQTDDREKRDLSWYVNQEKNKVADDKKSKTADQEDKGISVENGEREDKSWFYSQKKETAKEEEKPVSASRQNAAAHTSTIASTLPTQVNLNQIAASALRAKLSGDMEKYHALQKELEDARQQLAGGVSTSGASVTATNERVITLEEIGPDGRPQIRPAAQQTPAPPTSNSRKRRRNERKVQDGEVKQYFEDDNVDLKTLVAREKSRGVDNYEENFTNYVMKSDKFVNPKDMDDAVDFEEDNLQQWESKRRKLSEDAVRQRAIQDKKMLNQALANCWYCFESPKFQKHLMIALGEHSYIAIPSLGQMCDCHCVIVPMEHGTTVKDMDEDVFAEVNKFKHSLIKMFKEVEKEVVFIETVMHLKKKKHYYTECIPLSRDAAADAPMYFQKAIQEAGSEWGTHKKMINTREKGIRRSVPSGFPYFHVEFGAGLGLAHVIENEVEFSPQFGKEVLGGILELDATEWKKPKRQGEQVERQKVRDFVALFKPYDWTAELDGGGYGE